MIVTRSVLVLPPSGESTFSKNLGPPKMVSPPSRNAENLAENSTFSQIITRGILSFGSSERETTEVLGPRLRQSCQTYGLFVLSSGRFSLVLWSATCKKTSPPFFALTDVQGMSDRRKGNMAPSRDVEEPRLEQVPKDLLISWRLPAASARLK